jgi:hypothetical protein
MNEPLVINSDTERNQEVEQLFPYNGGKEDKVTRRNEKSKTTRKEQAAGHKQKRVKTSEIEKDSTER